METVRSPEMFSAPFLKMRKLLPQYPARPAFCLLSDKTQRVLGRVLEEYVDISIFFSPEKVLHNVLSTMSHYN
jgi:hypothetical protein